MKLSIIVATSLNHVIGVSNQLPWHLPADLKYFKQLTNGHAIVMGRKTFESIGRPLPNRINIVITRSKSFEVEGVIVQHSIEDALQYCQNMDEVFIIGGDTIYQQMMHLAQTIYVTTVHTFIENGDAFFPELDLKQWTLRSNVFHEKDDKNAFDYTFEIFEKVSLPR
ncbi:MAG: dihydrofolate reductase [Bacteroidetes bacterium]|nr:dihydrofolate reductase [Bacteroidota bacterium]MBK8144300.1 dihydrofolate reductase [Bacteroidota bacterium]